ncbi:MAG: sensor domain-containing diguanylate cyclase [Thermoleophilaceae bacterium]|nr:sensor domain-containing diguanylate cyclase [Thermoleophilaceae bacterium]
MLNTGSLTMIGRLGAMFERTASVRSDEDLKHVLWQVAHTIGETLGYSTVVVNIYRPAFDDMFTAAAVSEDEGVQELLGQTSLRNTWTPLFAPRFERRGAYFVPHGGFDWDQIPGQTYVPEIEATDDPEDWQPDDALFVPLRGAGGKLLGVVSVDEPVSGRRPSDADMDALVASSRHAALAIRIAQDVATAAEHQRMLENVLEVSARLAQAADVDALLQSVCDGIRGALDFEKVVIELADAQSGALVPVAAAGWMVDAPAVNPGMSLDSFAPLFTPEFEVAGCYLVPHDVAETRLGPKSLDYESALNGRGPHAWNRHWLLVPLSEPDGRRIGLIWVDDPRDRLLPSRTRLQALRLFANQAMSALHSADEVVRLRYEATHDPLTSLPNRRALLARLPQEVDACRRSEGTFALVLCDMDNLKTLNDTLGHEAGDVALQLLAGALRSGLRRGDDAYRLGGDEFAVVLPGAGRLDAERVTRRLREATAACAAEPVKGIDASFGIAVYEPEEATDVLMARADEALYSDKRRRESAA